MKINKLILLSLFTLLAGCSSIPTVHIYGKYLDASEKRLLMEKFEQDKYTLKFNELDFPTSITHNTLLYSLLLKDPETIDHAQFHAEQAGLPVVQVSALAEGNHWYTKNSMALFLFPQHEAGATLFFRQDLVHTYQGENCGSEIELALNENGRFTLTNKLETPLDLGKGVWKFRQYPYIELQKDESSYADYYFEISRYRGRDNISDIDFIKLTFLNSGDLPKECTFLYGMRAS